MKYTVTATIERTVKETFSIELEADGKDEAADVAYEVLAEYPNSSIPVNRLICTERVGYLPNDVAVLHITTEADEVYYDGA